MIRGINRPSARYQGRISGAAFQMDPGANQILAPLNALEPGCPSFSSQVVVRPFKRHREK
jgi:hypothetical protein